MRLNLACGDNKISGYLNIDGEISVKPDVVINLKRPLPFADESIDEIVLFHAIEHIEESYHVLVLCEFWRILKPNAELYVSYPEFSKCARNYIENYRGLREFWKNTIYGLQRYPGDYHVALMHTDLFVEKLQSIGFTDIKFSPEANENYNTVVYCRKSMQTPVDYEDLLVKEIFH